MKIRKSPSKKLAPLPPQLSELIKKLEVEPEDQIASITRGLENWPFPRGDLFHWVAVLDRFDEILSRICTDYKLKEVQTKPFEPSTKEIILAIVNLSRTLFENCTNRNIYNSYEHLNMLLNSFDMDVLQDILHFMIRPAQRINNPRAIRSSFVVPQDKVIELARGWTNAQVELIKLATDLELTPEMSTVNIQFYRTSDAVEGFQVVSHTITPEDRQKSDIDLFLELTNQNDIPNEYQFELANRIRVAKHMNDPEKRRQLLGIRILAISIMAHSIPEATAQSKVFIYEPYLIQQLVELISPEKHVDMNIQTFVLYALDAITRQRVKLSEVLVAVNASANHGTLMQILRKTNTNDGYPQCFLDALFTFVSYLLQTQPGGQMLMSAGVIPTLVQIVANQQYARLKNIAKVVGLLDTIVNSFAASFSSFCNVGGLDTLLNRIKAEIEICQSSNEAAHDRLSAIKSMLKFLLRMMESSGTTDGLRNLIDSSLPESLRVIMEHPNLFGNSIFALAINVSTTFIHNEPTSLPILQEAKLPQTFLHTISVYESSNNEVLMAAVNAFGAMCLNGPGLDMFNQTKPLPHFFDLMTSHDFLRNPIDIDSATGLGSTMDELIRHHPSLKPAIFQCVTAMIKKVLEMGSDMEGVGKSSDNSHLLQTRTSQEMNEDSMEDEDKSGDKVECLLVSFIDLVSRFLEGLFQNQSNIKEFVQEGCPEMLLNYYSLPLLPANFSVTIASDSLSYLFRMISEVSPLPTVLAIASKVKESVRFITNQECEKSMLIDFIDVKSDNTELIERGNKVLRQMIELHGYVGLLSNICCSSVLTHGKNGVSLVTEFLSESKDDNIIQLLGQLHRVMVWENLLLKDALPPSWYAFKPVTASTLKKGVLSSTSEHPLGIYNTAPSDTSHANTPDESGAAAAAANANATTSGERGGATSSSAAVTTTASDNGLTDAVSSTSANDSEKAPPAKDARMLNIKHFKLLLTEIPQLLMPIFQGLIKVSVSRRTSGGVQKPQTMKLAEYMADLLKDNIQWKPVASEQAPFCKYDYMTSVYTMTSLLLRNERTQSSLQTPLAFTFERRGGIDLLTNNLESLWNACLAIDASKKDERSRVCSAIEALLSVLVHISSPKSLRDSPYTASLVNNDTKSPDYFDPYEWIVALEIKLTSLRKYLESPDLYQFSKVTVQTLIKLFLQIMKGEGDFTSSTSRSDPFSTFSAPLMSSPFTLLRTPAPPAPSEQRVQTLLDMGFERSAAERALMRCNNQVSRAVDYLFSHPTPNFNTPTNPTDPSETNAGSENENSSDDSNSDNDDEHDEEHDIDHEEEEEEEENNDDDEEEEAQDEEMNQSDIDESIDPADQDHNMASTSSSSNENNASGEQSTDATKGESSTAPSPMINPENPAKIKSIREELCESLPKALLYLVDKREEFVFDVRDLLVALGQFDNTPTNKKKTASDIISQLLNSIHEIHSDASQSALLSTRLRLLALLLHDPTIQKTMQQLSDRFVFLFDMIDFSKDKNAPLPAWSATIFLVIEAFIAQADEPVKVKLTIQNHSSDDDDVDDHNEAEEAAIAIASEHRSKLLECCVSLLGRGNLSRDDIYAILRMIVRLTKRHENALQFVALGGLPLLFSKPKSSLDGLQGQQAFIILILRHIIESKAVLTSTMKELITTWFTNPRPRNMDITSFVRSNAHIALREPTVFNEVAKDMCRLTRYDEYEINRQIKLREIDETKESKTATTGGSSSSEVVIYYILEEIMSIHKSSKKKAGEQQQQPEKEMTEADKKQLEQENIKFVYTGFLLQCLVELISSYASCKYDVYSFCKKQSGRSFVAILINDLLPNNHVQTASEEARKQQGLSTWTASTLVSLYHDSSSGLQNNTQQKNELIQVRKYVLDVIVKSLKEAVASSDSASVKYSKYLALADLCHRILNARSTTGSGLPRPHAHLDDLGSSTNDDMSLSNAKLMLDKNLVAVLTTAINDVDVNYPHSKVILNTMLRPLEQLTKLAIKTEDVSDDEKDEKNEGENEGEGEETNEEGMQTLVPRTENEQEEAPDLYRHSSLGMLDAGSVIDEDEYQGNEYGDIFPSGEEEEEYDEDSGSDLSDMSEGDDEDDEVSEEMDALIHGRGYNSDDMDEDDAHVIHAEASLLDEDEEEEEEGREMTWHLEDIDEDQGLAHDPLTENGDVNVDQANGQRMSEQYEEDDDLDDIFSDYDETSENLGQELETELADGVLLDAEDLEAPFLTHDLPDELGLEGDEFDRPSRILPPAFRRRFNNPRRSLLEGVGRPYRSYSHLQGQEDVITHPLLSNTTSTPSNTFFPRSEIDDAFIRADSSSYGNWRAFENIIGGSAARMLEDLFSHAPPGAQSGPLRVDIQDGPRGTLQTYEFDSIPPFNRPQSNNNTSNRPDQTQEILALLHDFQAMSSGERWHQEARMMYGTNISEKALRLVNDLLNTLVPIAIEDKKKARLEEEAKRREQRRKEEEELRKAEEERWRVEKEKKAAAAAAAAAASEAEAEAETVAEPSTNEEPGPSNVADQDTTMTEAEAEVEPAQDDRTTVVINGEPVDITGTGIDIEFLEALPDDLREEVVNQHIRNRPAPTQSMEDDSISPEFLDALPPDIREEVLHQEAIERNRRDRQQRQTTTTTEPQDDVVHVHRRPVSAEDEAKPGEPSSKKKAKLRRRDAAVQLVDKAQLATLVRLLFIPQTISKSLMKQLLVNLCENSRTRSDLLSYLICVLYDGNNDLNSVDNSFLMIAGKGKTTNKSKNTNTTTTTENVPNFIVQRCLEALTHIVSRNEQSLAYFLTESELLTSLKRFNVSHNKKGKGKDKVPTIWNKYPILVLMSLLDRPVFINNSGLMEQLMDLLSAMCRPFPILVKKYEEKIENKQKDPNQSSRPAPKPPTIPDYYLKLVVHVLTNGECSSKTFQYTLNAISHLSALDGAQKTIVNELVADARQSGKQILSDLDQLLDALEHTMSGTDISTAILSPFSASTSCQAKLLRVLKTLDYMFSKRYNTSATASEEEKAANEALQAKNEKRVLQIYQDLNFLPLWTKLGKCLSVIREKEDLINVATVLLPIIESFMVISKCNGEKGQEPASNEEESESFFFAFTEKHKKVLNIMVRNNPSLMSGSFALLVRNPKMLEFDNKRNYFVQQLHKRTTSRETYAMLQLNVRRQYVFEDSYHQLQGRTGEEIKNGKLSVRFYDEEGVDAGGVTREWFSVLARQMFDPNYALFITSAADKLTYQPNRASFVNSDHLSYFKFVGRVIGKAIYDGRLLDAYFTRSFYKHILGRQVDYRDVEALDPEYYKSLVWMLENDITDIIDLTFSIETDDFGTTKTIDLKPDGRNIPVTEANKHEYVTLVTEQKLTTAIKDQINAFVQGFHDVIPAPLIQIFNEQELELLISGLPDVDIDDWKNNTTYQGYTATSSPVQWFWRAVRSFDQEERAKLLQFATGTSKVPLEGFAHLQGSNGVQKFQIHKDFGGENRLPSAHTCFNQVDLPQYDSYESLRSNLFKAINECSTGFAFV